MTHICSWRGVAGLLFETLVQNGVGGKDFDKAVETYRQAALDDPLPSAKKGRPNQ